MLVSGSEYISKSELALPLPPVNARTVISGRLNTKVSQLGVILNIVTPVNSI